MVVVIKKKDEGRQTKAEPKQDIGPEAFRSIKAIREAKKTATTGGNFQLSRGDQPVDNGFDVAGRRDRVYPDQRHGHPKSCQDVKHVSSTFEF